MVLLYSYIYDINGQLTFYRDRSDDTVSAPEVQNKIMRKEMYSEVIDLYHITLKNVTPYLFIDNKLYATKVTDRFCVKL